MEVCHNLLVPGALCQAAAQVSVPRPLGRPSPEAHGSETTETTGGSPIFPQIAWLVHRNLQNPDFMGQKKKISI